VFQTYALLLKNCNYESPNYFLFFDADYLYLKQILSLKTFPDFFEGSLGIRHIINKLAQLFTGIVFTIGAILDTLSPGTFPYFTDPAITKKSSTFQQTPIAVNFFWLDLCVKLPGPQLSPVELKQSIKIGYDFYNCLLNKYLCKNTVLK
jgi:hypothetical protein